MTKQNCKQCGASLRPYFLKEGVCNGCRNPESIVTAIVAPSHGEKPSTEVHKAITKPFTKSTSLCGENGAWVESRGEIRRVYGGAKRTTKDDKVTCQHCLDLMKREAAAKAPHDFISHVTSEGTGGGIMLDLVHLKDGRVIGVNDESICLYASESDVWEAVEPIACITIP